MGGWRWKQFQYVEPVYLLYSYWLFLLIPVMNQYAYYRYSIDVGFPYMNLSGGGNGGCSEKHFGVNSTLKELEIEVQTRSANLFTYYLIICVLPSVLVGPFMGTYSDKRGRKLVLMVPLVGAIVETGIIILIMYYDLSLYFIFVGSVLNGLSGYFISLWLSLMSYLADTVEKTKLSNRMTILNFCLFLAGTVAQLTSGVWIEYLGFKAPMWFMLGLVILAWLYTFLFVKETVHSKEKACFCELNSPKRMLQILTKPRKHGGRRNVILAIVILAINIMVTVGTSSVQLLFVLRSPLCFSPSILGYFLSYRFFALGVGSVAGIYLFKRYMNEINVARIGILSQVAGMMLLAFSNKSWMVFIVPVMAIFAGIHVPVLTSISSRIVSSEEQGILFALSASLGALGHLAGTALFNSLYLLSLRFGFPGFVFVFAAGSTVILMLATRFFDVYPDILNDNNVAEADKPTQEAQRQNRYKILTDAQKASFWL